MHADMQPNKFCKWNVRTVQGRQAKRKVLQEQESARSDQNNNEDLLLYKQAVSKMKESSGLPAKGRITELFNER